MISLCQQNRSETLNYFLSSFPASSIYYSPTDTNSHTEIQLPVFYWKNFSSLYFPSCVIQRWNIVHWKSYQSLQERRSFKVDARFFLFSTKCIFTKHGGVPCAGGAIRGSTRTADNIRERCMPQRRSLPPAFPSASGERFAVPFNFPSRAPASHHGITTRLASYHSPAPGRAS